LKDVYGAENTRQYDKIDSLELFNKLNDTVVPNYLKLRALMITLV